MLYGTAGCLLASVIVAGVFLLGLALLGWGIGLACRAFNAGLGG